MKKLIAVLILSGVALAQGGRTSSNILPATTGQTLGNQDFRWRTYATDLDVSGNLTINGVRFNGGNPVFPLTTKGDLFGYGTTHARVPVGTDGQCLVADSTQALGLRWGACISDDLAVGSLAVSTTVTAASFHGDGSELTGITGGGQTGIVDVTKGPYNVKNDGTGDAAVNATAFQSAIATGRTVWVPAGTYSLALDILTMTTNGQRILCENAESSKLQFAGASGTGITIAPPSGFLVNIGVENCAIYGPGRGTGTGVKFGGASSSHNGDWGVLRNNRIRYWATDLETYSWGQMQLEQGYLQGADLGWWIHGGSSNSYNVVGLAIADHTNQCLKVDAGVGGTFSFRDFGQCAIGIDVAGGAQLSVNGSNVESLTGPYAHVATNGVLSVTGARILGAGSDAISSFSVDANGVLFLKNVSRAGFNTATPMISKASSARVYVFGAPSADLISAGDPGAVKSIDIGVNETFRSTDTVTVPDNAGVTCNEASRFLSVNWAGRSGVADDARTICMRKSDGTTFANYNYVMRSGNDFLLPSGILTFNGNMFFGTSTNNTLKVRTNGTDRWMFLGSSGDILPSADNTYNFGSAANRVKETTTVLDTVAGANGETWKRSYISESITLSTSGATTDSTANLLPTNSVITGVSCRVTTTITTATDWAVGDATTAARFCSANSTLTAGTTAVCLNHQKGAVATDAAGPTQATAAKLRVTTTGTPGAGAVRCTVFYEQFVAPTS